MNYYQLTDQIRQNEIAPVYLLYGEENYLCRQVVALLKRQIFSGGWNDFNYELFDGETTSLIEIIDTANTLPVFSEKRLVLVKNTYWFKNLKGKETEKDAEQLLINYLEDPSLETCLVFLVNGKVDTRRKVYKALTKTGKVMECSTLKGQELSTFTKQWLHDRGKRADYQAMEYILAGHQGNLELLVNELEKLDLYLGERSQINLADVQQIMTVSGQNSIFELVDAVGAKMVGEAVQRVRKMLKTGESEVYILFMLARQLRLILQAKLLAAKGYTPGQLGPKMQVHSFVAQKALKQSKNFAAEELVKALEKILAADVAIKTGQGTPAALLENAVVELCL